MKHLFFTLLLCSGLSIFQSMAQSVGLVHVNQPFYVSGEVIWYKLYLPGAFPAGPKVITMSLIDGSGKLVDQSFLRRQEEEAVYGYYKIPFNWTSGIYRLVFSATEETAHQPVTLAEAFLPVYDDFGEGKEVVPDIAKSAAGEAPAAIELNDLSIEILSDQDSYLPRSTAILKVKITNKEGDPVPAVFSVSIGDQQFYEVDHPLFTTVHAGNKFADPDSLEEVITLRGTLFETNGRSILPEGNLGAYLVREKQFLYARADKAARFLLDLPDVYGPNPIHVVGFLPEDLLVSLDQQVDLSTPLPGALPHPPEVIRYLDWSRKRKLIYQLYGHLEHTFIASFPSEEQDLERADSPIVLDEYDSFSNIPALAKELLLPIRFRIRKDDTYEVRVFDPTQAVRKFHSRGPLFIVDGKLTRNADYIANLDIARIERFDLYFVFEKGMRLFGPMARNGLVMIQSRNRNVDVPEPDRKNFFTVNGFQAEIDYPVQIRDGENDEVLLRPSLFWVPNLSTHNLGEALLSIPLSDDHSRFRVEIVAQGKDGQRGRGETYFVVGRRNK